MHHYHPNSSNNKTTSDRDLFLVQSYIYSYQDFYRFYQTCRFQDMAQRIILNA